MANLFSPVSTPHYVTPGRWGGLPALCREDHEGQSAPLLPVPLQSQVPGKGVPGEQKQGKGQERPQRSAVSQEKSRG